MTLQQMHIMEKNLSMILKAENGSSDDQGDADPNNDGIGRSSGAEANTKAMGYSLAHMKNVCGKESFTLNEMQDPASTIRKYTKQDKPSNPLK